MSKIFSILIPSWNNLLFLKLCVASIRRNSAAPHQIIVHVNDGSDGTLEWVRSEGLDYTYTDTNVGVCKAVNMMRAKVRTDYLFYLNDDMYLLPGWDTALGNEVDSLPDHRFFLSGTMIQPHNPLDVGILADYGDSVETFDEERLLREYMSYPMSDWCGATWPPNLVHRDMWDLVGGYSIEYTPGMYSDPDFSAKLWMAGVRYFKGLSACRAYHFETKSTGRVRRNDGNIQFLLKWGVTNSVFRRQCTRLGEPWPASAASLEPSPTSGDKRRLCRFKAIGRLLAGRQFGPLDGLTGGR